MFDFLKNNKVITAHQANQLKATSKKINPSVLIGAILGFKLAGLAGAIAGAGAGFMMKKEKGA